MQSIFALLDLLVVSQIVVPMLLVLALAMGESIARATSVRLLPWRTRFGPGPSEDEWGRNVVEALIKTA